MSTQHFVVDGSNIATEGRTTPNLAQLQDGVRAFRGEYPDGSLTVVVDASFAHRIDESERAAFERAEARGELVSPPAGAIGRGDGFLLQIADRTNATVLSNDSFQEFHGEYPWLFDVGRLVGGKPVPGVGWIFSLRTPVRGARSRKATRVAPKQADGSAATSRDAGAATTEPRPPARPPKKVAAAIAAATADALAPAKRRRSRRRKGPSPEAVNDPASFLQFLIDHRLGSEVQGSVEEFASHGAFVAADGVRAYVPLGSMGDPAPTRARDVLDKGERRTFVVQAVDAPRRAIELGLPGFTQPAGAPTEEMVEAVTRPRTKAPKDAKEPKEAKTPKAAKRKRAPKAPKPEVAPAEPAAAPADAADAATRAATKAAGGPKKRVAKKITVKKAAAPADDGAGRTAAEKTPAKKTPAKETPAKKASAKKAAAEQAGAAKKKATPKKVGAKKKAGAKKATPKKVAADPAAVKLAADKAPGKTAKKAATRKRAGS